MGQGGQGTCVPKLQKEPASRRRTGRPQHTGSRWRAASGLLLDSLAWVVQQAAPHRGISLGHGPRLRWCSQSRLKTCEDAGQLKACAARFPRTGTLWTPCGSSRHTAFRMARNLTTTTLGPLAADPGDILANCPSCCFQPFPASTTCANARLYGQVPLPFPMKWLLTGGAWAKRSAPEVPVGIDVPCPRQVKLGHLVKGRPFLSAYASAFDVGFISSFGCKGCSKLQQVCRSAGGSLRNPCQCRAIQGPAGISPRVRCRTATPVLLLRD